ncbi:hypothetical protein [Pelagibacterium luteolum]|nr:hypothetical protein [Pelagibacterium luteolum]
MPHFVAPYQSPQGANRHSAVANSGTALSIIGTIADLEPYM